MSEHNLTPAADDADGRVSVRDLVDELRHHLTAHAWRWWGDDDEAPQPGDEAAHGYRFDHTNNLDEAHLILLPWTSWGDYAGSVVDRVNHDILAEDYTDEVVRLFGGYSSHGIALVLDGAISEALADEVRTMAEYGYLGDGDRWSALEDALAREAWDDWQAREFRESVAVALVGGDHTRTDAADLAGDLIPDDEALLTLVWETGDVWINAETATSAFIGDADRLAETVAGGLIREHLAPWEIDGQGFLNLDAATAAPA